MENVKLELVSQMKVVRACLEGKLKVGFKG